MGVAIELQLEKYALWHQHKTSSERLLHDIFFIINSLENIAKWIFFYPVGFEPSVKSCYAMSHYIILLYYIYTCGHRLWAGHGPLPSRSGSREPNITKTLLRWFVTMILHEFSAQITLCPGVFFSSWKKKQIVLKPASFAISSLRDVENRIRHHFLTLGNRLLARSVHKMAFS